MASNSSPVKFVEISRASFDALSTKNENTLYVVKELNGTRKFYQGQYNLTGVDADSVQTALNGKQNTLVSGTNIKTVNGNSLLGSGNITISGGGGTPSWQLVRTVNGTTSLDAVTFSNALSSLAVGRYLIRINFTENWVAGEYKEYTFIYEKISTNVDFYATFAPCDVWEGIGEIVLTNNGLVNLIALASPYGLSAPIGELLGTPQVQIYREVYS